MRPARGRSLSGNSPEGMSLILRWFRMGSLGKAHNLTKEAIPDKGSAPKAPRICSGPSLVGAGSIAVRENAGFHNRHCSPRTHAQRLTPKEVLVC